MDIQTHTRALKKLINKTSTPTQQEKKIQISFRANSIAPCFFLHLVYIAAAAAAYYKNIIPGVGGSDSEALFKT